MSNLRSLQMVKYIDPNEHRNAAIYRHQEVDKWYEEDNGRYTPIHVNDPDYYLRRDEVRKTDDDYYKNYMKNHFAMIDSGQVNHNDDHIPVDYYEKERDKWYEEDDGRYNPIHANDPDLRHDEARKKDDDYYKTYMENHFTMIDSEKVNHNDDHIPVCYENEIDKWYDSH